jgi:YVTN family beta-propeller protein
MAGWSTIAALTLAVEVALVAWASPSSAGPKLYVGLFRDNAIAVVDTATNRVLGTIPVPRGPHGLVVTPDGRKLYVASDGDSLVSVIDTASDRVVATVDVGPNPHGLAMAPDGKLVLVLAWGTNQAVFLDTGTDRVVGRVPVAQPHNGTIGADGRSAWVASQQQGATALVRIDIAGMKEAARVPLDKTPRALDLTPDGSRLYFTVAGLAAVRVLDTATGQVAAEVPVGASPHQAPVAADGRWALVAVQGPGELAVIDTATNTVAATIPVGKTPHWVTLSSDGAMAYVSNEVSNDVSVVDLVRRAVVATIPVGNTPRKVAVQPGPIRLGSAPVPVPAARRSVTLEGVAFADHGTLDVGTAAEVTLRADDYYFAPTFLRGRPGQRLRLNVENAASTLHNLSMPALGIDRDLPPLGRVDIEVTVPATGPVAFFCKFHGPLGQNGQVLVSRPE